MSQQLAELLPKIIAETGKLTARELASESGYSVASVRAAATLAGIDLARDRPGPKPVAPQAARAEAVGVEVVRAMVGDAVRERLHSLPPVSSELVREAVYQLVESVAFRETLAKALMQNGCAAVSSVLFRNNGRAIADALFAGHPPKLSQSPARTGADRLRTMVGFEGPDAFAVFGEWLGPAGRREMGEWIMKAVRHDLAQDAKKAAAAAESETQEKD